MKKILAILMFLAAFGLIMGCTSAAVELTDHDFDGHFSMTIPKKATFKITNTRNGLLYNEDT